MRVLKPTATTSSKIYVLVHFCLRVFYKAKNSFLFGTTGIRAGSHTPCETLSAVGDVSKVGYFFDIPASLKLSLYTVMT